MNNHNLPDVVSSVFAEQNDQRQVVLFNHKQMEYQVYISIAT